MAYGPLGYERHEWLEDWLEAFPGSIICTSHFDPFPGQDVHAQRRLPGAQTENLRGHKGQLLDTARGKASERHISRSASHCHRYACWQTAANRREHLEGPGLAVGMRGTARIAPPGETHAENTHRLHHVALRWKR